MEHGLKLLEHGSKCELSCIRTFAQDQTTITAPMNRTKTGLSISFATSAEERLIAHRLRHQILIEELGYCVESQIGDYSDTKSRILVAYDDGIPVGTLSLDWWKETDINSDCVAGLQLDVFAQAFSRDSVFLIKKAAVLPSYRRSAAFWKLILTISDFALRQQAPYFIFLDCDVQLMNLYRRIGFRSYAPPFRYKTGDLSMPMCAVMNDLNYLKESESLLYKVARRYGVSHLPEVERFCWENWHSRTKVRQPLTPQRYKPSAWACGELV